MNRHPFFHVIPWVAGSLLALASLSPAQEIVTLDSLVDWQNPSALTSESVAEKLTAFGAPESQTFSNSNPPLETQRWKISGNAGSVASWNGNRVESVYTTIQAGRLIRLVIRVKPQNPGDDILELVTHQLNELTQTPVQEKTATYRTPQGLIHRPLKLWQWNNSKAELQSYGTGTADLQIYPAYYVNRDPLTGEEIVIAPQEAVNADKLLGSVGEAWQCTPEKLESLYQIKSKSGTDGHFEWVDSARTRARFSQRLNPGAPNPIKLFDGKLLAEEWIIEFVNGKAAKMTISLYNRGDAGETTVPEFQKKFITAGQELGRLLQAKPRNASAILGERMKSVVWEWKGAQGVALLEHNDFDMSTNGQPEYLRLKLAAPDQLDWSMGKISMGVQKMVLLKNVRREASGDVYISGVPMVDQGAKGYCVAATCQRMMEYLQLPCDQHQIAEAVGVDAQSGANIFEMQKGMMKLDGRFNINFKPHINPEMFYGTGRKRRISQRQFVFIIKEHIDKGIPLLWALQLGMYPEDPPLPSNGQITGGHMRMIIGYNATKKQVLFSDSWGAGHELKRMNDEHGWEVTAGLYTMAPYGW